VSNFLAVATVTEALRSRVTEAAVAAVPGVQVEVTSARPDAAAQDDGNAHVSVFLYRVEPNAAHRNLDLPTRRHGGALIERPRAPLELHYLLSFFGNDSEAVAERMLGATVARLHARPVLERALLETVIASQPFLAGSDLADAAETVKLTQEPLSLEDLSKLWSVFFQVPYCLSVAYQATTVILEEELSPQSALPVRGPTPDADPQPEDLEPRNRDGRRIYVETLQRPRIESIVSAVGDREPIVAGGSILIRGFNLRGAQTGVTINGVALVPPPADPGEREIEVALTAPPVPSASLRAGIVGMQVIHERSLGDPEAPHRGVESNAFPVVLRPVVQAVAVEDVVTDGEFHGGVLVLTVSPPVGADQRLAVFLSELVPPSPPAPALDRPPRAYRFDRREEEEPPEATTTLRILFTRVRPADYLVRLQVDGAESVLTLGELAPGIQQYTEPAITIP
jgi:hypothetical protein